MRRKTPKLIVTFDTTAAVMALESACAGQEHLGRIIPTPQEISAGCGLAWCAPPEARMPWAASGAGTAGS